MSTRDHTVPQAYLRRFAHRGRRKGHFTRVVPVREPARSFRAEVKNVSVVAGFYWGTDPEGIPHHAMEQVLGLIETAAAPVFATLLDEDTSAIPLTWPLGARDRDVMAYWMSAQLLRTTRQRRRLLAHLNLEEQVKSPLAFPAPGNNQHLQFLATRLGALAGALTARPWGILFSDCCLPTSDVPVVMLNGQDAQHQVIAALSRAILLPLDPHRLLFLPDPPMIADDRRMVEDHRGKLPGGLGIALSQAVIDAADTHVFIHPEHDPLVRLGEGFLNFQHRLPEPEEGGDQRPMYAFSGYDLCEPNQGVARRWLRQHPPAPSQG